MYVIKLGTGETFPAYLKDLSLSQTLAKVMKSMAFQFNFRDRSTKELTRAAIQFYLSRHNSLLVFFLFSFLFTKSHLQQCKRINKETEKLGSLFFNSKTRFWDYQPISYYSVILFRETMKQTPYVCYFRLAHFRT